MAVIVGVPVQTPQVGVLVNAIATYGVIVEVEVKVFVGVPVQSGQVPVGEGVKVLVGKMTGIPLER